VNYVAPKARDVAMVFQDYALYPHMTVERNLAFPLRMRRRSRDEIARRVHEVAASLEMTELLGKYPDQLSGGQRQRVALGRAMVRDPVAFLMDEPLSNLDALLRTQMREELLTLHRRLGRTTVYVTHDQIEAMTMADRIVVLRAGVVQQIGAPAVIYERPANVFVATFVGAPQINLIEGTVDRAAPRTLAAGPLRIEGAADAPAWPVAEALTLGVRPEDLRLVADGEGALAGRIVLVEAAGHEKYVRVEVDGDASLVVRASRDVAAQEGARCAVAVDWQRAHWFGADGGRLEPGAG
jgi:ABC-type sugar transport system ATPase subunit